MKAAPNHPALRPDMPCRPPTRALAAVVGAVLVLAVAACSGSPDATGGVASLSSPGTGSGPGGAGASPGSGDSYQQELAYSQCMRAHGLADFPDPQIQPDGTVARRIEVQQGSDLDPATPRFQAARKACQSLVPAPAQGPRTQERARQQAQALRYAQCMRTHGVPTFPDPDFSNGISFGDNGTYDPNSPSFQAADGACGSLLSGGGGAPGGGGPPGAGSPVTPTSVPAS